jgi:hypothetical protein
MATLLIQNIIYFILFFFKATTLPTYTTAGLDLTTHNSAGGDVTTRPRRLGDTKPQPVFLFSSKNDNRMTPLKFN